MSFDRNKFIDFLLEQDVLQFGEFTLKSGRQSPYFFNLGKVASGLGFAQLGEAYAQAILAQGFQFDVLFGPAYKGIPLAAVTARISSLEEGYALLEQVTAPPEWAIFSMRSYHYETWNPEGVDPRYEAQIKRFLASWGVE